MGQTALLPLRRKACWGFFFALKNPCLNPRTWVPNASTPLLDHRSRLSERCKGTTPLAQATSVLLWLSRNVTKSSVRFLQNSVQQFFIKLVYERRFVRNSTRRHPHFTERYINNLYALSICRILDVLLLLPPHYVTFSLSLTPPSPHKWWPRIFFAIFRLFSYFLVPLIPYTPSL